MNQAYVRAVLGDYYNYRVLHNAIADENIEGTKQRLQNRYRKITNEWNIKLNSEWILRHYLSVKMIMSTTLMLNSLEYSKERNVKIVEPYLRYYSLLTICRGLLFTIPEVEWNEGKIMTMTHQNIINKAYNALSAINKTLANNFKKYIIKARDIRELFSYKFPADGMGGDICIDNGDLNDLVTMGTMIAEISQFQSEQLEFCLRKISADNKFEIDWDIFAKGCEYEGTTLGFIDQEDWYRLDYFKRKQPYPLNLYFTLREGMVDDFFGAWGFYDEDGKEDELNGLFNSDENITIIFDMP